MSSAMKCFIAGTVIVTETGFARIEDVKPGDIVLSTNTIQETGCKKVLEKYVRKTRELVHIIVDGKKSYRHRIIHTMLKEEDLLMPVSFV